MKKYVPYIALTLGRLLIDMLSKYIFYTQKYMSGIRGITPSFNTGIARSLPMPLWIVVIISILVLIFIIKTFRSKPHTKILLTIFVAGTLGNMIDRVTLGGVRDFIHIQLFNFPIFNIADILINIGIIGLVFQSFILEKRK